MKATIWKSVFAAMSPSPMFEAIAEFAERRADERLRAFVKQINRINGCSRGEAGTAGGGESHRDAVN
jgi:hypothetical protein